ncbi:MAG: extracellular solute-binding protein [Candidatus Ornithospirochaeta sp.]
MKKAIVMLMALALVAIPVFAQGSAETAAVDETKPVTIEFWTHEDAARQALEEKYIAEYTASHPNVTINVTRQSAEKLRELVQTAFAAGQGPTFFNLPIENEYQYIEAGRVAPADYKTLGFKDAKDLIGAYADGMIDAVVVDGEVYGLPLELTNWSIFINKNVFRAAGLDPEKDYPKTWEDMVEVSKKIVLRDGDIITRRGFDFRYSYELTYFVPMVEQFGGSLDGEKGCVNEEAWVKALQFMKEWGPEGNNLGNPTLTAARKLFNKDNGDIAMCNTGLYQEARILSDNPDFYNSGEWMVVPYPVFEDAVKDVAGCYYGHFYMVNADASKEEQKVAWDIIKYFLLTEGHAEEYLTQVGLIQPTNALLNSETYANMPYSAVFSGDFARAHIVYHEKGAAAIQSAINTAVKSVMLQGVDPKDAYKTLQTAVMEILED